MLFDGARASGKTVQIREIATCRQPCDEAQQRPHAEGSPKGHEVRVKPGHILTFSFWIKIMWIAAFLYDPGEMPGDAFATVNQATRQLATNAHTVEQFVSGFNADGGRCAWTHEWREVL